MVRRKFTSAPAHQNHPYSPNGSLRSHPPLLLFEWQLNVGRCPTDVKTGEYSIDDRATIVETRSQIGDREVDIVIGKNHRQAIVRIVERKTALAVSQAMIGLLKPHRKKVHMTTSDNGKELSGHEEIASKLKADFCFAHPYSSWERGTNVSTNGLIRLLPKKRDFIAITQQEIYMAMERLNSRPRKILGYQTPSQMVWTPPSPRGSRVNG